jgi:glycosyltransferase involved in cell wall biosynthesis
MACGIPTVVSNRSSLPEVVGEVGLRVNPEDADGLAHALYLALTDSDRRAQWRAAGIDRAATFTWDQTARTVVDTYRRVLAAR